MPFWTATVLRMSMPNRTIEDASEYMSPGEAGALLHVHTRTISRMADRGEIRTIRVGSGHRRYKREDVLRFLDQAEQPTTKANA